MPAGRAGIVRGTAVVALGGNAFTRQDQSGTYAEMAANALAMACAVRDLRESGWQVVVVHGNGPQVGNLSIQQEAAKASVPPQPLATLVAMTQGAMGSLFALALREVYGEGCPEIATLVTHLRVDPHDPGFGAPSKPIGPFYSWESATRLAEERDWAIAEDAGRGYRRVVASPQPLEIVESRTIRTLLDAGTLVIAAGGGGIPVALEHGHLVGVEAVIDKDLAAALLAGAIRARSLVLVTGVDAVMVDFGTDRQRPLHRVGAAEMRRHLQDGQFPEGSMGPKVRACLSFLDGGGGCAVITSPALVAAALAPSRLAATGAPAATRIVANDTGVGAA
jgi:carbamate kinase